MAAVGYAERERIRQDQGEGHSVTGGGFVRSWVLKNVIFGHKPIELLVIFPE